MSINKNILFLININFYLFSMEKKYEVDDEIEFIEYIKSGNIVEVQKYLNSDKISVNCKDANLVPALSIACYCGQKDIAQILISYGAEIDAVDPFGESALMLSSREANKEMIDLLISYKAKINLKTFNYKNTALHWAAMYGQRDIVQILIKNGANVFARDADEKTPADIAFKFGYDFVGEIIADRIIQIGIIKKNLFEAILDSNYNLVKKLITQISLRIFDENKNNAFHYLFLAKNCEDKIKIFDLIIGIFPELIFEKNSKGIIPLDLLPNNLLILKRLLLTPP